MTEDKIAAFSKWLAEWRDLIGHCANLLFGCWLVVIECWWFWFGVGCKQEPVMAEFPWWSLWSNPSGWRCEMSHMNGHRGRKKYKYHSLKLKIWMQEMRGNRFIHSEKTENHLRLTDILCYHLWTSVAYKHLSFFGEFNQNWGKMRCPAPPPTSGSKIQLSKKKLKIYGGAETRVESR